MGRDYSLSLVNAALQGAEVADADLLVGGGPPVLEFRWFTWAYGERTERVVRISKPFEFAEGGSACVLKVGAWNPFLIRGNSPFLALWEAIGIVRLVATSSEEVELVPRYDKMPRLPVVSECDVVVDCEVAGVGHVVVAHPWGAGPCSLALWTWRNGEYVGSTSELDGTSHANVALGRWRRLFREPLTAAEGPAASAVEYWGPLVAALFSAHEPTEPAPPLIEERGAFVFRRRHASARLRICVPYADDSGTAYCWASLDTHMWGRFVGRCRMEAFMNAALAIREVFEDGGWARDYRTSGASPETEVLLADPIGGEPMLAEETACGARATVDWPVRVGRQWVAKTQRESETVEFGWSSPFFALVPLAPVWRRWLHLPADAPLKPPPP